MDAHLEVLKSIDASLKALLDLSRQKRGAVTLPAPVPAPAQTFGTEADLDKPEADEILKAKMPRDWTKEDYKGSRMSQCPPDLLDLWASRCDFFAQQNDERGEKDDKGRPKSFYDKRTAARCRGWAQRLRSGWTPKPDPPSEMVSADEVSW